MVQEIQEKTLLASNAHPDSWFGLRYNMNLYRGCQHACIYCDSRSECYGIDDFTNIQVKTNAIELLRKELSRKRIRGAIGTGSMNDPYMPLESERRVTRQALEVIASFHFPVHIITKSARVLRDLDLLEQIAQVYAAVSVTITCASDDLGKKIEPGASLVSERLKAIQELTQHGVVSGVTLMPVLPWITDDSENILQIVRLAHAAGARYILASFGVTLRDRQRAYYYEQLERLFPGLRRQYERQFGGQYFAPARNAKGLEETFQAECARLGIATRMPFYAGEQARQPNLFDML